MGDEEVNWTKEEEENFGKMGLNGGLVKERREVRARFGGDVRKVW